MLRAAHPQLRRATAGRSAALTAAAAVTQPHPTANVGHRPLRLGLPTRKWELEPQWQGLENASHDFQFKTLLRTQLAEIFSLGNLTAAAISFPINTVCV